MLHLGHRERLRNKAMDYGIECLEEHEALELLLGYAIPRKNTNDIAHELINRSGGLNEVFELDSADVKKVSGMGDYSAFLLKLVRYCMKTQKKPPKKRVDMSRYSAVADYAKTLFATAETEALYALLLDKKLRLIRVFKASSGNAWQAGVSKKEVLKAAIDVSAAALILLHNHPGGTATPSADDLNFTIDMERACKTIELPMLEHIVYSDEGCHPIMMNAKMGATQAIEYDVEKTV